MPAGHICKFFFAARGRTNFLNFRGKALLWMCLYPRKSPASLHRVSHADSVQTERRQTSLTREPEPRWTPAFTGQSLPAHTRALLALAGTLCPRPALGTSCPCAPTSRETPGAPSFRYWVRAHAALLGSVWHRHLADHRRGQLKEHLLRGESFNAYHK